MTDKRPYQVGDYVRVIGTDRVGCCIEANWEYRIAGVEWPDGTRNWGGTEQLERCARPQFSESEHSPPTVTDGLLLVISNYQEGYGAATMATQHVIDVSPQCEQVQDGIWTVEQAEVFLLAYALKEWIELEIDDMPLVTFRDCVRAQLARDAFDDVDWDALARHCLERVKANDTL